MFSELLAEEGLSNAGFASNGDFEWFQTTVFAEFILYFLNVCCETIFAVPVEIGIIFFRWLLFFFFSRLLVRRNEESRRLYFDIQHEELAPVEVKLERSTFGMNLFILNWDIN